MSNKVSIIMPVLNGAKYIGEALDSILAQTYKNYELIVVNDGSTDATDEHVRAYMDRIDIKVVRHTECQGIAASVNDGFRHASGDSITFLDHDDVWKPHMLATQVAHLEQHPDVGMVHSDFQTIDPLGNVIEESVALCRNRQRPSGRVFRELFLDSFIAATSVLIRKECIDKLGGFDETLLWGDYHLWLRIARNYKIDYIPQVLTKYRQHDSQSTRTIPTVPSQEDPVAIAALKSILELYPEARRELGERVIRHRMAAIYFGSGYYYFEHGQLLMTRFCLARAIQLWPTNKRYILFYLASFLKPSQVSLLRGRWHQVRSLLSPQGTSGQWQGGRVQ